MLKPNKLGIKEMWRLYKTLEVGFIDREEEVLLIDEAIEILKRVDTEDFKKSLAIMYGQDFHSKERVENFSILFVEGIKENNLFAFTDIIRSFSK